MWNVLHTAYLWTYIRDSAATSMFFSSLMWECVRSFTNVQRERRVGAVIWLKTMNCPIGVKNDSKVELNELHDDRILSVIHMHELNAIEIVSLLKKKRTHKIIIEAIKAAASIVRRALAKCTHKNVRFRECSHIFSGLASMIGPFSHWILLFFVQADYCSASCELIGFILTEPCSPFNLLQVISHNRKLFRMEKQATTTR